MGKMQDNPMFNPELDPANPKVMRSKFFGAMLVLSLITGIITLGAYYFTPELVPGWVPQQLLDYMWVAPLVTFILGLPATNFGLLSLVSPPMDMGPKKSADRKKISETRAQLKAKSIEAKKQENPKKQEKNA